MTGSHTFSFQVLEEDNPRSANALKEAADVLYTIINRADIYRIGDVQAARDAYFAICYLMQPAEEVRIVTDKPSYKREKARDG